MTSSDEGARAHSTATAGGVVFASAAFNAAAKARRAANIIASLTRCTRRHYTTGSKGEATAWGQILDHRGGRGGGLTPREPSVTARPIIASQAFWAVLVETRASHARGPRRATSTPIWR